jgi:hypothetical protein
MMPIEEVQFKHHNQKYHEILIGGPEKYDGFINPNSYWYWEHIYCMEHISNFFRRIPKSTFLTVGDGYCGREGSYIHRFGHIVHSSDWEPCLISVAKDRGLVDGYSCQNMYDLKFPDGHFNYSFVKESLHHLSMPYKGLYELFRVADRGTVIIEPNGDNEPRYKFSGFEEIGNFMYPFSSHELIKTGLAYGFKYFVITYSIVFFSYHDEENIRQGKIEDEKQRLILFDKSFKDISHKPLLIVFFLRNKEDMDLFEDSDKFRKVTI